jgi:hypothetical protein
MATEIKSWQIINDRLTPVSSSMSENGRKERDHLELWIKSNPEILGSDIAIIGEQVQTKSGPLDFIAIDEHGYITIIELKRDRLERSVIAQAIDYASDVASFDSEKLDEICQKFTGKPLSDYLDEKFDVNIEEIDVNQKQHILLVGFSITESLERMINWLSQNDVVVNAIYLQYIMTATGDELLSKTAIISEDVEREIKTRHTLRETSNSVGTYPLEALKEKLKRYFRNRKNRTVAIYIRDYFIPILLQKNVITREQLKQEFLTKEYASDLNEANQIVNQILRAIEIKGRDYLRQVVSYENPNDTSEKDNFSIRPEYKELVEKALTEWKN